MNLTFLCLWDFILFVQYNKSKQNKLKVLSYTNFVFNAYIIIYAGSVFFGTPCINNWLDTSGQQKLATQKNCRKLQESSYTNWNS